MSGAQLQNMPVNLKKKRFKLGTLNYMNFSILILKFVYGESRKESKHRIKEEKLKRKKM